MAKRPKNTREAADTSGASTAATPVEASASTGAAETLSAASAEAGVAASAALASDSLTGDAGHGTGQGDTLAAAVGGDALAAGEAVDSTHVTPCENVFVIAGGLMLVLEDLAVAPEVDDPFAAAMDVRLIELEHILRARRPAEKPAPVAPAEDDGPDQPTKAQAAAAVKIPEDQVFAWRWDGEQLTVVTVAGQKLRFRP